MKDTEHIHQVTFVNWFRANFEEYLIFAIPNGELRAISIAQRLKAEGVTSGVPDLCCLLPEGQALWVEMKKAKGGKVSKEQKAIHEKMRKLGHIVTVCNGYEEAMQFLKEFIKKPLIK